VQPSPGDDYLERALPKLAQLKSLAKGRKALLAQTHDFPDPDTISSALALTWLMGELSGIQGDIGYGGIIGRAENRAMIKVLGIKLRKTTRADFSKYDLVALLDTQPECGNHSVPADRGIDIVVDHHFARDPVEDAHEPAFVDVGGGYGTTSTKVAELVRAAGLEPPPDIATALFYGVKSDTMNLTRVTSPADMDSYLWLFPFVDNKMMTEIEHPQVPLDYFRVFNKAIERGKIYGNMIVADLGEVYTPELCAELADRLLQVQGVRHALATGWYQDGLFLSLRTRGRAKNAGKILNTIVTEKGIGSAGGHQPMAGARIEMEGRTQRSRTDLRRKLIHQVIRAFGQDPRHFQRIVTKPKKPTTKPKSEDWAKKNREKYGDTSKKRDKAGDSKNGASAKKRDDKNGKNGKGDAKKRDKALADDAKKADKGKGDAKKRDKTSADDAKKRDKAKAVAVEPRSKSKSDGKKRSDSKRPESSDKKRRSPEPSPKRESARS